MPAPNSLPEVAWWAAAIVVGAANLLGFAQMGWDKRLARLDRRRLSESRLRAPIWAGGSLGIWLGMRAFRHKSRKASFLGAFWLQTAVFAAALAALAWTALR